MDRPSRLEISGLAVVLLLVGFARHYGWAHFPAELRGVASKGLGGAAILVLLSVIFTVCKARLLAPVIAWWAWEESQVVLCSAAYMLDPWVVPAGQALCSSKLGFDLGALGLVAVAAIAYKLTDPVRHYRSRSASKEQE